MLIDEFPRFSLPSLPNRPVAPLPLPAQDDHAIHLTVDTLLDRGRNPVRGRFRCRFECPIFPLPQQKRSEHGYCDGGDPDHHGKGLKRRRPSRFGSHRRDRARFDVPRSLFIEGHRPILTPIIHQQQDNPLRFHRGKENSIAACLSGGSPRGEDSLPRAGHASRGGELVGSLPQNLHRLGNGPQDPRNTFSRPRQACGLVPTRPRTHRGDLREPRRPATPRFPPGRDREVAARSPGCALPGAALAE